MTMQRHKTLLVCAILLLLGLSFILSPFVVSASAEEDNTDQIKYFGTAVACGKDNGYRQQAIKDDPHKGWTLGSFFVKGFSGVTQSKINAYNKDMPVYLKNAGDTVTFGFKLDQNIDKLKQLIFDKTVTSEIHADRIYLTNTRHIDCVRLASESLSRAIEIFDLTTFDIISSEIKSAWSYLGEVSGVVSDEAIIDKIFSKFCLGK